MQRDECENENGSLAKSNSNVLKQETNSLQKEKDVRSELINHKLIKGLSIRKQFVDDYYHKNRVIQDLDEESNDIRKLFSNIPREDYYEDVREIPQEKVLLLLDKYINVNSIDEDSGIKVKYGLHCLTNLIYYRVLNVDAVMLKGKYLLNLYSILGNKGFTDFQIQHEALVILHNSCVISTDLYKYTYESGMVMIYHQLLGSSNIAIQNLTIMIITLISESSEDGCLVLNKTHNTFIVISSLIANVGDKETLDEQKNLLILNYFNSLIKWKEFRLNFYIVQMLVKLYEAFISSKNSQIISSLILGVRRLTETTESFNVLLQGDHKLLRIFFSNEFFDSSSSVENQLNLLEIFDILVNYLNTSGIPLKKAFESMLFNYHQFLVTALLSSNVQIKSVTCSIINQIITSDEAIFKEITFDNEIFIKEILKNSLDLNFNLRHEAVMILSSMFCCGGEWVESGELFRLIEIFDIFGVIVRILEFEVNAGIQALVLEIIYNILSSCNIKYRSNSLITFLNQKNITQILGKLAKNIDTEVTFLAERILQDYFL